jgi:peptidoglycan/LPS O-acetylase OafA/YrhL
MNTSTDYRPNDLHRQLKELTERSLSPTGRYAHVLLMVVAAGMGSLVAALLITEPALPFRTQAAFGVLVAIAACWVGYSAWALFRRPLMHAHRVVAGTLATTFSGLFAVATLTAAVMTESHAAGLAGAMGLVMLAIAVALLLRAHRQRRALLSRRDEIERALAGG